MGPASCKSLPTSSRWSTSCWKDENLAPATTSLNRRTTSSATSREPINCLLCKGQRAALGGRKQRRIDAADLLLRRVASASMRLWTLGLETDSVESACSNGGSVGYDGGLRECIELTMVAILALYTRPSRRKSRLSGGTAEPQSVLFVFSSLWVCTPHSALDLACYSARAS